MGRTRYGYSAAVGLCLLMWANPSFALDQDFTLTLQTLPGKISMCHLSFGHKVPSAKVVDDMLAKAMSLCRMLRPAMDMEAMAFRGDDALETGKEYSGAMEWRKQDKAPRPLMLGNERM